MSIKEELEKKGYDKDKIYDLAEKLVENMIETQPLPKDLDPKQYMVMGAAAAASSILSQIDSERLKDQNI